MIVAALLGMFAAGMGVGWRAGRLYEAVSQFRRSRG